MKTIVIKFGTSLLTRGGARLDQAHMINLVGQCAQLHGQGQRLILVSSGAVAAGRDYLGNPELPNSPTLRRMLASVGQTQLMNVWAKLFAIYDLKVGQMLLTRADIEQREHFLNGRDTLLTMLEQGIIPIINENDAVATAEARVGDNDNLAALVAMLARADQLILLTDQEGLYDDDPRQNPGARLIREVREITPAVKHMAGGSGTALGTGGMATKVAAAELAGRAAVETIVCSGFADRVLLRWAEGSGPGTRFLAAKNRLESRKQWLFGAPRAGRLFIDAGAETALVQGQKSLLAVGVRRIEGDFPRGAVVEICSVAGEPLALGLVRQGSENLAKIKGQQSAALEAILGYPSSGQVVHRDDLILL